MTRVPRILLMDDDEDMCFLTARMAQAIGMELDAAEDDDEVLARFETARTENRPYDVVILDASIPGGRGAAELIGEFKAKAPSLPVIVTSGWSEADLVTDCGTFGFSAALVKPFDRQHFADVMEHVLGLHDGT